MKQITYDEAIELIAKYSKGLSDDKEIDPKKDQFTIVLPLEHHQMIIVRPVNEDEKGSYFGFYEERPDGTYSKVGLDTFTHCPMCGRKL